jgi:hypothetical protein
VIRMRTPAANSISIAPADLTELGVAVLAAAGYNFSLLLRWFRRFIVRPVADPGSIPVRRRDRTGNTKR